MLTQVYQLRAKLILLEMKHL